MEFKSDNWAINRKLAQNLNSYEGMLAMNFLRSNESEPISSNNLEILNALKNKELKNYLSAYMERSQLCMEISSLDIVLPSNEDILTTFPPYGGEYVGHLKTFREIYDDAGNSSLREYMEDIENFPPMTSEEEISCYEKASFGDIDARNRLMNTYLRLPVLMAGRYEKYITEDKTLEEIIYEGNLGLMKAAETFECYKSCEFSDYAAWWIYYAIKEIEEVIFWPKNINIYERINEIREITRKLFLKQGHMPSAEEIADEMELSAEENNEDDDIQLSQLPISLELGKYSFS